MHSCEVVEGLYVVALMFVTDLIVSAAINFSLIHRGVTKFKADC